MAVGLGELDPRFNGGKELGFGAMTSGYAIASSIVSLPDGTAYVAGHQAGDVAKVAKLTFDGAQDTAFGIGGFASLPIPNVRIVGAALQPDGKLAVASVTRPAGGTHDFAVFRVDPQGTIDSAFGLRSVDFNNEKDIVHGILAQPDGKLILYGDHDNGNRGIASMVRLNGDGTLDTSFGSGGKVLFESRPRSSQFSNAILQSNGTIMLVGYSNAGAMGITPDLMIARFLPTGVPDSSFGPDGVQLTSMLRPFDASITPAPDGGFYLAVGDTSVSLRKHDSAGMLDTGFAINGVVSVFTNTGSNEAPSGLLVQADGSILVSNRAQNGWILGRVLSTGVKDFVVQRYLGTNSEITNPALQPDGRVLIGGGRADHLSGLQNGMTVARYQSIPLENQAYFNEDTGRLNIFGTEGLDTVAVNAVDAGHVAVSLNGVDHVIEVQALQQIDSRLFGGNDSLDYDTSAGSFWLFEGAGDASISLHASESFVPNRRYRILGQEGNETLNLTDGNGSVVEFDGGTGTDRINLFGTAGPDVATYLLGQINSLGYDIRPVAVEALVVDTGDGNDVITSDDSFSMLSTIRAGAGDDEFHMLPSSQSSPAIALEAGQGNDEIICLAALTGTDFRVTGSLLECSGLTAPFTGVETIRMQGGQGTDAFWLSGVIEPVVHVTGSSGSDLVVVTGSAADDVIELLADTVLLSGLTWDFSGIERVWIAGSGGNDDVTLTAFPPGASVTVFGQAGNDELTILSAPPAMVEFEGGTEAGSTHQLNVLAGTYTFAADAKDTTAGLSIDVGTGAAVTFNTSQHIAALRLNGGAAIVNGNGTLLVRLTSLAIQGGGNLDIKSNSLIYDYSSPTSPLTDVLALLMAGRNGGSWDGSGIRSSAAAVNTGSTVGLGESSMLFGTFPAKFLGETIDASTLLLRYTINGDATLDRTVDARDLVALSTNWLASDRIFAQGDFTFDNLVNAADLTVMAAHWQQSATIPPPIQAPAGRPTSARHPTRTPSRMINLIESP